MSSCKFQAFTLPDYYSLYTLGCASLIVVVEAIIFCCQSARYKRRQTEKYQESHRKQSIVLERKHKRYAATERLALFAFTNIICLEITLFLYSLFGFDDTTHKNYIFAALYAITLALSTGSVLIFHIFRLKHTFKHTIFAVNFKTHNILVAVTIGSSVTTLVGMFIRLVSLDNQGSIGWIIFIISWTICICIYIFLCVLFCRKLFQLILMQQQSRQHSPRYMQHTQKNNNNTNNNNNNNNSTSNNKLQNVNINQIPMHKQSSNSNAIQLTMIKDSVNKSIEKGKETPDIESVTFGPQYIIKLDGDVEYESDSGDNDNNNNNNKYLPLPNCDEDHDLHSSIGTNWNVFIDRRRTGTDDFSTIGTDTTSDYINTSKYTNDNINYNENDLNEKSKDFDNDNTANDTLQDIVSEPVSEFELSRKHKKRKEKLSQRQLKLLENITRQTTLIIFASSNGFILTLASVILGIFPNNNYIVIVYYFVRALLAVSFQTSLWLSFSFAKKQYNFCCGICHNLGEYCCVKMAVKKINKTTS